MPEPLTLTFTRSVNASPEEAFRAFTHATALRDWLCHAASNSPHKGGYLFLHWNEGYSARGSYTLFDPPHKLAFTWDGSREPGVEAVDLLFEASGRRYSGDAGAHPARPHTRMAARGRSRPGGMACRAGEPAVLPGDRHRPARRAPAAPGHLDEDEFTPEKAQKSGRAGR